MKKALIISIAFNVLIISFIAGKRYYYSYVAGAAAGATASQKYSYDTLNDTRNSLLSSLPIDSTDIVFIGNSLTEGFPVNEIFGPRCKNRGIGGNRTYHLLDRIPPIAMRHPKKVFIEAGVNDLRNDVGVDTVFKNYQRIINIIKELSPSTFIYVQSIFPTSGEYAKINDAIVQLNSLLADYCTAFGLKYIDVHAALLRNGRLDDRFTEDGMHLNGNGYAVWTGQIKKYVQ